MKPKFVIADHALRSMMGHFYEYDISVAASVPENWEAVIVSNNLAEPEVKQRTIPFFQCDFWGVTPGRHATSSSGTSALNRVHSTEPLIGNKHDALKTAQLRKSIKKLVARAGLMPLIRAIRESRATTGAKLYGDWIGRRWGNGRQPLSGLPSLNAFERELKDIFLSDLVALFEQLALTPADLIFLPNLSHWSLAAIAELPRHVSPQVWPRLKFLFRRNILNASLQASAQMETNYWTNALRASFGQLTELLSTGHIQLYTDTEPLRREYETTTPFPFEVLPIPFRHDLIQAKSELPQSIQVGYLGEARVEKGFGYLPGLVNALQADAAAGHVRFVFQAVAAPEPETISALNQLKLLNATTLLDQPLTDHEYYGLLNASHIILLLYDPLQYRSRSSCIFIESVISATPCITMAGSWMASCMEPGTGEVVASADQIAPALRKMIANYADYQAAIGRASERWAKIHNPRRLVEMLLAN